MLRETRPTVPFDNEALQPSQAVVLEKDLVSFPEIEP